MKKTHRIFLSITAISWLCLIPLGTCAYGGYLIIKPAWVDYSSVRKISVSPELTINVGMVDVMLDYVVLVFVLDGRDEKELCRISKARLKDLNEKNFRFSPSTKTLTLVLPGRAEVFPGGFEKNSLVSRLKFSENTTVH